MRRFIFITVLLVFFGHITYAQEATVTMSISEYERAKGRTDSLNIVISNYIDTINSLKQILESEKSSIEQFRIQLGDVTNRLRGDESLIITLRDSLRTQTDDVNRLRNEVASLDMVRIRYANGRLQLPFNEEKIRNAIELFDGISDKNLKVEYNEVRKWLTQYSIYLQDIKELVIQLQSDKRRENPFTFDDWRKDALTKISQDRYVINSDGHDFSIYYLDDIISIARMRLKKAQKAPVDFSDLIERLQLQ